MNLGFQDRHAAREILAEAAQDFFVHQDAAGFHVLQHHDQRAVHGLVNRQQFFFAQARFQQRVQTACDVGILGGIGGGFVQGHAVEGDLVFAAAADVGELDGLVVEMQLCQLIHAVAVAGAFEDVGNDDGVVYRRDVDALAREDVHVEFDVVPDLQHRRIFQQRLQKPDRILQRNLRRRVFAAAFSAQVQCALRRAADVAHGDIAAGAGGDGQRDADHLRLEGIEAGGFRIDRHPTIRRGGLHPAFQIGHGGDGFISARAGFRRDDGGFGGCAGGFCAGQGDRCQRMGRPAQFRRDFGDQAFEALRGDEVD